MNEDGYRYDLRPPKHGFNHARPCVGKCGSLVGILGCFLALIGPQWPQICDLGSPMMDEVTV